MWRIFSKTAGIVAYVCLQAVVNSICPPGPHHSPKQAQVTGTHSVAAPQDINASPTGLAGSGHNPLPLSLGRKKQHWSSAFKLITPSQLQVSDQWVSVPFFHFIKCLNPSRPPLGLPWCSDSKESTCNAGEPGWIPGSGRSPPPRRRAWLPTPVFLPGKSHGQRSLEGYSPWDRKESDTTEKLTLVLPQATTMFTNSIHPALVIPLFSSFQSNFWHKEYYLTTPLCQH